MGRRIDRSRRPALEGLEWRLAPSGMGPGPDGGRNDAVDQDNDGDRNDNDGNDNNDNDGNDNDGNDNGDRNDNDGRGRNDNDGGGRNDNGSWEPKPIGHGSTRPNVPSGPVRW